jgi:serine/threonine protein phosphatase PrpC
MSRQGFGFGNATDVGRVREKNEDYFGYFSTPNGQLFLVCDGMGGYEGGQRASRLAVECIKNYVEKSVELDPAIFLRAAFDDANRRIRAESAADPALHGMGTTCLALLLRAGKSPSAWSAHIGDSRTYRIRQNRIKQITRDHSRVAEMVAHGLLTPEEAEKHPERNVITRALGTHENAEPEIMSLDVCKNDRFVLCTDGVSGPVPPGDILQHSRDRKSQPLAEVLVRLANERGGEDNATCQIVDVLTGPRPPKLRRTEGVNIGAKRRRILWMIAAGALVALFCAMVFILFQTYQSRREKATKSVTPNEKVRKAEEKQGDRKDPSQPNRSNTRHGERGDTK